MQKSKFVIVSAGMSMFDSLYMKKNIICIPQYKHQLDNLYSNNIHKNLILIKDSQKDFSKKLNYYFDIMLNSNKNIRKNKILFNRKNMNNTLNTIAKLLYE